jgi:hypothetical protein
MSFMFVSVAFTESIFTKLPLVEWHYVDIFCIKSDINQLRNPEVIGRNSFTPLRTV